MEDGKELVAVLEKSSVPRITGAGSEDTMAISQSCIRMDRFLPLNLFGI